MQRQIAIPQKLLDQCHGARAQLFVDQNIRPMPDDLNIMVGGKSIGIFPLQPHDEGGPTDEQIAESAVPLIQAHVIDTSWDLISEQVTSVPATEFRNAVLAVEQKFGAAIRNSDRWRKFVGYHASLHILTLKAHEVKLMATKLNLESAS